MQFSIARTCYRNWVFVLIIANFCLLPQLKAQNYAVAGKVTDWQGEALVGATVVVEHTDKGTITDAQGYFSLRVDMPVTLKASFTGYNSQAKTLRTQRDTTISFELELGTVMVDEVTVQAARTTSLQASGVNEFNIKEIEKFPGLLGDADPLQALKLMAGVQSAGEGGGGLVVRGSGAGHSLVLLDDMPLYNPSHLMALSSIVNSDALQSVTLYKGNMPAQYGGRVASVLSMKTKSAVPDRTALSVQTGLIASKVFVHVPLAKKRGCLLVSYRNTYLDLLVFPLLRSIAPKARKALNNTGYSFYDMNARFSLRLGSKSEIRVSGYTGGDTYRFNRDVVNINSDLQWGNRSGIVQLLHTINSRLLVKLSVGQTAYAFKVASHLDQFSLGLRSEVGSQFVKLNFTNDRPTGLSLKYGAELLKHRVVPNNMRVATASNEYINDQKYTAAEGTAYLNAEKELQGNWWLSAGLRATAYAHLGPYYDVLSNAANMAIDTVFYAKNQPLATYFMLSPSATISKKYTGDRALSFSYNLNNQLLHYISVGAVSFPSDIWMPSTKLLKPEYSHQLSGTYTRSAGGRYGLEAGLFGKYMTNQIEFTDGLLSNFDRNKMADNITFGRGWAYGAELFLKKQQGKLTGWLSYSLMRSMRQFEALNNGKPFAYKYDRTHDLALVANYAHRRWGYGATFIFATGNATTLPIARYMIQGNVINQYSGVNSFRMPAYHRLDVSATYRFAERRRGRQSVVFSVYNVYNRANPFFVYFETSGSLTNKQLMVEAKQLSLFRLIPSLTYQLKL